MKGRKGSPPGIRSTLEITHPPTKVLTTAVRIPEELPAMSEGDVPDTGSREIVLDIESGNCSILLQVAAQRNLLTRLTG
jgi:hypothetical protein